MRSFQRLRLGKMLKLHVFLVDTGIMYTFDMEMALERYPKIVLFVF